MLCAGCIALATPTIGYAEELNLVCEGGGTSVKMAGSSAYATDSWGNNATINGVTQHDRGFSDVVGIRLGGENDRVRLPRTMLPAIHGGEDGWFKLSNVEFVRSEIRATAKVNPINNPKITIDRVAGTISISGKAGDFAGKCRKYDPQSAERQF